MSPVQPITVAEALRVLREQDPCALYRGREFVSLQQAAAMLAGLDPGREYLNDEAARAERGKLTATCQLLAAEIEAGRLPATIGREGADWCRHVVRPNPPPFPRGRAVVVHETLVSVAALRTWCEEYAPGTRPVGLYGAAPDPATPAVQPAIVIQALRVLREQDPYALYRGLESVPLRNAAAMLAGLEPGLNWGSVANRAEVEKLHAACHFLLQEMEAERLPGRPVRNPPYDNFVVISTTPFQMAGSTDIDKTLVSVAALRTWCEEYGHGIRPVGLYAPPADDATSLTATADTVARKLRPQRRKSMVTLMALLQATAGRGDMPYKKALAAVERRLIESGSPAPDSVGVTADDWNPVIADLARAVNVDRHGARAALVRKAQLWNGPKIGRTVISELLDAALSAEANAGVETR